MKEIYSNYEKAVINHLENIDWSVTPESEKSTYTALKNDLSCRFTFFYENPGSEMPRMLRIDSGERLPETHVQKWRFYNKALSGSSDGDDTLLGFQLASGNNWKTAIFIIKDNEICESDFVKYGCPLFEEFTTDNFSTNNEVQKLDSVLQLDSVITIFTRISLLMLVIGFPLVVGLWSEKGAGLAIKGALVVFVTYISLLVYFFYDYYKNKFESPKSPLREKFLFLLEQADPSVVLNIKEENSGIYTHLPCLSLYGDEIRASFLPVYHFTFKFCEGSKTVLVQFLAFNILSGIVMDSIIIPPESASILISTITINNKNVISDSFVFNEKNIENGVFSTKLREILYS